MKPALITLGALLVSGATFAQGADDCANAQVIAGLGPHFFDNTAATKDGPNDCNDLPARKDVWFRWTAPQSGGYIVQTCQQTNLQTRIMAYDFQACPVSTPPLGCAGGGCTGTNTKFSFPTVAGQDYLIRLGSRNFGQSGTGTFTMEFDNCWNIPDDGFEENDTCEDAAPVGDGTYTGLKVWKLDLDWYAIDVADGGTVTIDILFLHTFGDIDIALYDACGGTILDQSGSANNDEAVTWTNATGSCVSTRLFVEHFAVDPNGECNNYDMIVVGSSPAGTCNPSIGNNYCGPANPNSTGQPAIIAGNGSVLVADNNVTLTAFQLPPNQFGMFLNSMTQGFIQNPGGSQGNLCLKGSIGRYNRPGEIKGSGAGGEFSLVLDLTDTPQPTGSVSIMAGETWNFTTWFRDIGGNSNFTDGLEIMFL